MVNPTEANNFTERGTFTPTEEQKAIFNHSGNCVISAGPGSGKTTVLSHKIKLILESTRPFKGIAAISFTNKASRELYDRVANLSKDTKNSFFGTMDSFYISNIIIPFGNRFFGHSSTVFTITKASEKTNLKEVTEINAAVQKINLLIQKYEGTTIEKLKEEGRVPILELPQSSFDFIKEKFSQGTLDIRFVAGLATLILISSAVCQKYLSSRFTYLMIDEFQDSGYEQFQIFLRIKELGVNCWAVGDINQFLYRFAQKDPKFLKSLLNNEDFDVFPLTENHRSHPSINHYGRTLLGYKEEYSGENRIFYRYVVGNEKHIGKWFNDSIDEIKSRFEIHDNSRIGILAKKDITLALFAAELDIPYKFFHKTPLDDDQTPTGNLLYRLLSMSFDVRQTTLSFVEEFLSQGSFLDKALMKEFKRMVRSFKEAVLICYHKGVRNIEVIKNYFKEIVEFLYPNVNSTEQTLILLDELLVKPKCLAAFIPADRDEVQLMNIHKSKGLEFDCVIHLDLYKYNLPGGGWTIEGDIKDYEDTLNLHYVAVTRARKALILASSSKRYQEKKQKFINAEPSEFILDRLIDRW